jgi:hypothetical protein
LIFVVNHDTSDKNCPEYFPSVRATSYYYLVRVLIHTIKFYKHLFEHLVYSGRLRRVGVLRRNVSSNHFQSMDKHSLHFNEPTFQTYLQLLFIAWLYVEKYVQYCRRNYLVYHDINKLAFRSNGIKDTELIVKPMLDM